MDSDQLYELMNGEEIYTLIDVRQEIENYYGYIPGSVNIPRGSLEFNIGKGEYWDNIGLYMPEKEEIIVVYCKRDSVVCWQPKHSQKWVIPMFMPWMVAGKPGN